MITYLWKLKGEALAALGDPFPAVSMLQAALENASATGERFLLWRVHASLHNLYKMVNNLSAAQEEYIAAIKVIDEIASMIPDENMKGCYLQGAYKSAASKS